MRITVFTSNQPRHVALIETLAHLADELLAVLECTTVFPGQVPDFFQRSEVMQRYFARVLDAEARVFGPPRLLPAGVRSLSIRMGDLNRLPIAALAPALEADLFVVFGASWIRGPLCERLVSRGAINVHMGVAPQYRGSSTNFWALYDGRPELVGATLHRLTAGLDSGPILFHALPPADASDPFLLGMQAVRAAHLGLAAAIGERTLSDMEPAPQDRALELRYTRNRDFTDAVAAEYLERLPTPESIAAALRSRKLHRFVRAFVP